jgi:CRP/FNR family transcriptional regulator
MRPLGFGTAIDDSGRAAGPDIKSVPLTAGRDGPRASMLSAEDRRQLALIATVVHVRPGIALYRQGTAADAVYNLVHGVAKTTLRHGRAAPIVTAFLFPNDLLGLSEGGRYLSSAVAVTAVTAYRMPTEALERLLRRNAELEYRFLCKVCHELREAQRHAIVLGRKLAVARIALFLLMLEHRQRAGGANGEILVAMTRSDIADYVGLSAEAVSRAFGMLTRDGVIVARDRHHVRIADRTRFERLVAAA